MVAFIDDYRAEYGVEPICAALPIAELLSNVVDRHDKAATFWCVSSRSIFSPLLN